MIIHTNNLTHLELTTVPFPFSRMKLHDEQAGDRQAYLLCVEGSVQLMDSKGKARTAWTLDC